MTARTPRSAAPTSSARSRRPRSSRARWRATTATPNRRSPGRAQRIDAVYQMPFLAHAAMEPMNCTVHVRRDGCDVWVGTQAPTLTHATVAELTGLPKEAVEVHDQMLGRGFGRGLDVDGTARAVKVAQQVEGPVRVVWSREEDIQHDTYRPYYYDRLSAGRSPIFTSPLHSPDRGSVGAGNGLARQA